MISDKPSQDFQRKRIQLQLAVRKTNSGTGHGGYDQPKRTAALDIKVMITTDVHSLGLLLHWVTKNVYELHINTITAFFRKLLR